MTPVTWISWRPPSALVNQSPLYNYRSDHTLSLALGLWLSTKLGLWLGYTLTWPLLQSTPWSNRGPPFADKIVFHDDGIWGPWPQLLALIWRPNSCPDSLAEERDVQSLRHYTSQPLEKLSHTHFNLFRDKIKGLGLIIFGKILSIKKDMIHFRQQFKLSLIREIGYIDKTKSHY